MVERLDASSNRDSRLSKVKGSLMGGAVGDALGYPIEFMRYTEIVDEYGPNGIEKLDLPCEGGTACTSDDTQMTLSTAVGLLFRETRWALRGMAGEPSVFVGEAYRDWRHAQDLYYTANLGLSWLLEERPLYEHRAPGTTCMNALEAEELGTRVHPINASKGCGGVMRVAPVGLFGGASDETTLVAADTAALTHGHPLGYISAAAASYIIARCAQEIELDDQARAEKFAAVVEDCEKKIVELFDCEETNELAYTISEHDAAIYQAQLLQDARERARNGLGDAENIHALGGGWVAEETLAIAVYAAACHIDNFTDAVRASVNHDGDSDSTGAVCGNIMGAILGSEAIPKEWEQSVEWRETILEVAEDLATGVPPDIDTLDSNDRWLWKYQQLNHTLHID